MIISEHPQNTDEWLIERSGIPTASNFSKIITGTGKPSTSANTYMNQLLAEWWLGGPVDENESTHWMERGIELEAEAAALYGFMTDTAVAETGFCFKDDKKLLGASPDRFVGDKGLLEIKCPKASTVVGYILKGGLPAKYKQQVQGQMWVCEKEFCDFFVYHPDMKPLLVHAERDDRYIKQMADMIEVFIEDMLEARNLLKQKMER